MGRPAENNWKALHREWERTTGLTLMEFCEARTLNYTNTSRNFQKIDDANSEHDKRLTARILTKNGPDSARQLVALSNSEDEAISLKAVTANLGMIGFSAQSAVMANQVNVQVNLPAMFSNAENQAELKSLLQGELRQDGIIDV